MGFTHYIYRKNPLNKSDWKEFKEDVAKVLGVSKVPLTYLTELGDVEGFEANEDVVNFNGKGYDSHETFYLQRRISDSELDEGTKDGFIFNFCKTNQKPYDICVVATLILAKMHFGKNVRVASDGSIEDWRDGKNLVENTLGGSLSIEFIGDYDGDYLVVYYQAPKAAPMFPEVDRKEEKDEWEEFKKSEVFDIMG